MSNPLEHKSEYFTPMPSVYSKRGWQLLERSADLVKQFGYIGLGDDGGNSFLGGSTSSAGGYGSGFAQDVIGATASGSAFQSAASW